MRALPIDVYRCPLGDCTNKGISSRYKELLLVCPQGHVTIDDENPPESAVQLVTRALFGDKIFHIEPLKSPAKGHVGWIMGGNFAYSCDSRFGRMIPFYGAVPIHDRQETVEYYNSMD